MKYYLGMLLLISFSYSCNAQKKNIIKNPEISSKYEFFDKKLFSSILSNQQRTTDSTIVYISSNEYSYQEKDSFRNTLQYYSSGAGGDGGDGEISGFDYSVNKIVGIYKEFYASGGIKTKGIYCWFGFKIGLWYYYDTEGNVTTIENCDKGFSFTTDDVFLYCMNNNISLEKIETGPRTTISKYTDSENKSYWYIHYPDTEKPIYINIQIDAITGHVINKTEHPFPRFEEDE
jgi:hypothetical protein